MQLLKNNQVTVNYNESDRYILAIDLTDQNNQPAVTTRKKRGLRKAAEHIQAQTNQSTTFQDIWDILDHYNLSTDHWCMMD